MLSAIRSKELLGNFPVLPCIIADSKDKFGYQSLLDVVEHIGSPEVVTILGFSVSGCQLIVLWGGREVRAYPLMLSRNSFKLSRTYFQTLTRFDMEHVVEWITVKSDEQISVIVAFPLKELDDWERLWEGSITIVSLGRFFKSIASHGTVGNNLVFTILQKQKYCILVNCRCAVNIFIVPKYFENRSGFDCNNERSCDNNGSCDDDCEHWQVNFIKFCQGYLREYYATQMRAAGRSIDEQAAMDLITVLDVECIMLGPTAAGDAFWVVVATHFLNNYSRAPPQMAGLLVSCGVEETSPVQLLRTVDLLKLCSRENPKFAEFKRKLKNTQANSSLASNQLLLCLYYYYEQMKLLFLRRFYQGEEGNMEHAVLSNVKMFQEGESVMKIKHPFLSIALFHDDLLDSVNL